MKTLMTLSSGVEIKHLEENKSISADHYECMVFNDAPIDSVRIRVQFLNDHSGVFGVLRGGSDSLCSWSVHMSAEEAVILHHLLPQVKFSDERIEQIEAQRKKILSATTTDWLNKNCMILDTETTGLGNDAEIVEISVIDAKGSVLLNSLVRPSKPIPQEATAIHGITNAMVASAPTWDQLHQQFTDIISNTEQPLVIYNEEYDLRILNNTARIYGIPPTSVSAHCAMHAYAVFYGQWDNYREQYKWQKLTNAVKQCGYEIEGAHRSLSDCQMTLQVLQFMAANGGAA